FHARLVRAEAGCSPGARVIARLNSIAVALLRRRSANASAFSVDARLARARAERRGRHQVRPAAHLVLTLARAVARGFPGAFGSDRLTRPAARSRGRIAQRSARTVAVRNPLRPITYEHSRLRMAETRTISDSRTRLVVGGDGGLVHAAGVVAVGA